MKYEVKSNDPDRLKVIEQALMAKFQVKQLKIQINNKWQGLICIIYQHTIFLQGLLAIKFLNRIIYINNRIFKACKELKVKKEHSSLRVVSVNNLQSRGRRQLTESVGPTVTWLPTPHTTFTRKT